MSNEIEAGQSSIEINGETGPYELARYIVEQNPEIEYVYLRAYGFQPIVPSEGRRIDAKTESTEDKPVSREFFLDESKYNDYVNSLPPEAELGLCSKVIMRDGSEMQIPMMDLQIEKSPENLDFVVSRLNAKGINTGWLLESGKSYHYYGIESLTPEQWIKEFIANCLLTSDVRNRSQIIQVVDARYIGHALRRGTCCLRLTARNEKTFVPRVVYDLEKKVTFLS